LSFSERERFAERVGVLLGVEEEAPSDMVTMAIWLDRELGDEKVTATKAIEGDEACGDVFSDRRALIPYQNVMESVTLNVGRWCVFILDNIQEITSRRDYIDHDQDGIESVSRRVLLQYIV
jgi:hypothetical protein